MILFALAAVAASVAVTRRRTRPYPASLAWFLDNPLSARLLGTEETLNHLGLQPGQHILEVGPGSGRLLIPAAQRVLPGGTATGLELQSGMVQLLQHRAEQAGATNLTVRQCYGSLKPGGTHSISEGWPDPHYQPRDVVQRLAETAGIRASDLHEGRGRYTATFMRL